MKYFLLKLKINGIKAIDKEIELHFCNNVLSRTYDFSRSKIKAIYGANGAGKTGLVYAMEIYKNLLLDPDYLALCNSNGSLDNLINQNIKKLTIESVFACIANEIKHIYLHHIEIQKSNGKYIILEEYIKELKGFKLGCDEKFISLIHIVNGEIVEIAESKDVRTFFVENTKNLLNEKSIVAIMLHMIVESKRNGQEQELKEKVGVVFRSIIFVASFIARTTIVLQESDKNYVDVHYLMNQIDAINLLESSLSDAEYFNKILRQNKVVQKDTTPILKDKFDQYESYVSGLAKFIRVFKDDLTQIEIKRDDDGDYYECELILHYNDGRKVNRKYESTGIKKLMQLYSSLCDVYGGKIVFIDEFDANIHDILLMKLIEFIKVYASGQFIFTTHNLTPMDILQKEKHSIDFLSTDSHIVSWRQYGNASAASIYSKGLIDYSPFNIEAFSFIGAFGEGS